MRTTNDFPRKQSSWELDTVLMVLAALVLSFVFASSAGATGKYRTLYRFRSGEAGSRPASTLLFDSMGNLYGTGSGGNQGCGVVFELISNGNGGWRKQVIYSFNGKDGFGPNPGLVFDSVGNLYGTTVFGGAFGEGAVFELMPQGNGSWKEKVLHSFRKRDGYLPSAGVIFDSSGNLYGTAGAGGDFDDGAVFELTPTGNGGWKEKLLHSFNHLDTYGYYPSAGLIFDSAGNLYSTTSVGGAYGNGTVFELTPRSGGGWRESVLHSFNATDGSYPYTGLILDSTGNLYGATAYGGAYDAGTAFEITRDKAGRWKEKVLHIFNGIPNGPLIFDVAGSLYGTTYAGGGDNNCGTVFRLQPNASGGWEETVLHRRMKAKLGPQAATMATAHKIAVIFYTMVKNQVEYDETIWDARDAQREKKLQAKLKRQAKQLGYELVPIEPQAA
jgi:uncharacterized repeat protein (TIGR03803 family)